MLGLSFAINEGSPAGASDAELLTFAEHYYTFAEHYYRSVLWGSWLQAGGPALIVFFTLSLVHLAGAAHRLAGWMTLLGTTCLITVSLVEVTFYISALHQSPPTMPSISLAMISAVQHLYFIIAAPVVFLPLGAVFCRSNVLPKIFGYSAIALGCLFAALGAIFMLVLTLPDAVTGCAAVQALWWLTAAIALIVRKNAICAEIWTQAVKAH